MKKRGREEKKKKSLYRWLGTSSRSLQCAFAGMHPTVMPHVPSIANQLPFQILPVLSLPPGTRLQIQIPESHFNRAVFVP